MPADCDGSATRLHSLLIPIQKTLPIRGKSFVVRKGDPPPLIVLEIKFGGDNCPRPEFATSDFMLKVIDLIRELEHLGNGTLSVRDPDASGPRP